MQGSDGGATFTGVASFLSVVTCYILYCVIVTASAGAFARASFLPGRTYERAGLPRLA